MAARGRRSRAAGPAPLCPRCAALGTARPGPAAPQPPQAPQQLPQAPMMLLCAAGGLVCHRPEERSGAIGRVNYLPCCSELFALFPFPVNKFLSLTLNFLKCQSEDTVLGVVPGASPDESPAPPRAACGLLKHPNPQSACLVTATRKSPSSSRWGNAVGGHTAAR
ncbi:uncharacterized protein [Agelaius tricolor]|uniref:uncharacterized protein n=1 Tax=Agelaius tricolor TaxID=9191 RepID=UPI0039F19013